MLPLYIGTRQRSFLAGASAFSPLHYCEQAPSGGLCTTMSHEWKGDGALRSCRTQCIKVDGWDEASSHNAPDSRARLSLARGLQLLAVISPQLQRVLILLLTVLPRRLALSHQGRCRRVGSDAAQHNAGRRLLPMDGLVPRRPSVPGGRVCGTRTNVSFHHRDSSAVSHRLIVYIGGSHVCFH